MNIVLIGMRGCGKTTVAKLLSKKLQKEYVEMDELISQKIGMTIPEIVEKYGWDYFRDRESERTKELSLLDDVIISTGGGVVTRSQNIELLKQNGLVFFLTVRVHTLLQRIGEDPNRPSLTGKKSRQEDMEEVWKKREKLYKQAAHYVIDTENNTAEQVAHIIIDLINP